MPGPEHRDECVRTRGAHGFRVACAHRCVAVALCGPMVDTHVTCNAAMGMLCGLIDSSLELDVLGPACS
jgi:hypothetical protein